MENIIILIVVNVIAVAIFLVYQSLSDADKSQKKLPEILEKTSKEAIDNKMKELIFSQFGEYILNLFAGKGKVDQKELQEKLNNDFPFYKKGENDLFYDLRNTGLIKRGGEQDEYFELGNAFRNLTLNHPKLIKYLCDKCKEKEFKHNIPTWKNSITEAEITRSINLYNQTTYFSFGVCWGDELAKKIKISSHDKINSSFYLYGKAYNESDNTKNDKITFQDYVELNDRIDYKEKFNTWSLLSIPI